MACWLTRVLWRPNRSAGSKGQVIEDVRGIDASWVFRPHYRPSDPKFYLHKTNHGWKQDDASPRVLVVEDDPDIRLSLCVALQGQGYACLEAEHGAEAVEILLASPIDVVITDYQMPVMDGLQLIEWLEKASGQNHPPVILLTGDMNERVREKATRGGVFTILSKPYEFQVLLSALTKAIRRNEQNQRG